MSSRPAGAVKNELPTLPVATVSVSSEQVGFFPRYPVEQPRRPLPPSFGIACGVPRRGDPPSIRSRRGKGEGPRGSILRQPCRSPLDGRPLDEGTSSARDPLSRPSPFSEQRRPLRATVFLPSGAPAPAAPGRPLQSGGNFVKLELLI